MRTRRQDFTSFEQLMRARYGNADAHLLRPVDDLPALLAAYHGAGPSAAPSSRAASLLRSSSVVSATDDGRACLRQRSRAVAPPCAAQARGAVSPMARWSRTSDLAEPAPATVVPAPSAPVPPAPAPAAPPAPTAPVAPRPPAETTPVPTASAPSAPAQASPPAQVPAPAVPPLSDAELLAELEAIVKGKSVYDPAQKRTVPRETLKEYPRPADPDTVSAPPPAPGTDTQAIFDRLAQSMQHAGAYDLGTVDLENRFADFDRVDDLRNRARKAPPPPKRSAGPVADGADFIQDLDRIRTGNGANETTPADLAREASVPTRFATPFYASGEHALTGLDLYPDALRAGASPGVMFSYGEIVAMADLFKDADQFMRAPVKTLQAVKTLVAREAAFYAHRGGSTVGDAEWQAATDGVYITLADDNYAHFGPRLLYRDPRFAGAIGRHEDHRAAWRRHHTAAIARVRQIAQGTMPALPNDALVINAFGDHYLTDAFAAGHVINKAEIVELFKARFLSGSGLSGDANEFFGRVADGAWATVGAKFSRLETADPYDAWWNIVDWRPDINSASRLASVLRSAAAKEPERIANLAVKALHDVLNRSGLEVRNDKGRTWRLTGDGHLSDETLSIMKDAVRQSAANIVDPAVLEAGVDLEPFMARVWAYVPTPTAGGQRVLAAVVEDYVKPTSAALTHAAVKLLEGEVDLLIELLTDPKKHALRRKP